MEQSSLQVVGPLQKWSLRTIPFPSGEVNSNGTPEYINFMDYISAGCKKNVQIVRLEKRPAWSCYGDPKFRAVLDATD